MNYRLFVIKKKFLPLHSDMFYPKHKIPFFMKFTKEKLSGKDLEELKSIAAEYGIKPGNMDETALIYEILDKSAIESAAAAKDKEKPSPRKRTRMKMVDHVYSANQNDAVKVSASKNVAVNASGDLFSNLFSEQPKETRDEGGEMRDERGEVVPEPKEGRDDITSEPQNLKTSEPQTDEAAPVEAPKKRGRKPSSKNKKQTEAEEAAALLAGINIDDDEDERVEVQAVREERLEVVPEASEGPVLRQAQEPGKDDIASKPQTDEPAPEQPGKKKRGRPKKVAEAEEKTNEDVTEVAAKEVKVNSEVKTEEKPADSASEAETVSTDNNMVEGALVGDMIATAPQEIKYKEIEEAIKAGKDFIVIRDFTSQDMEEEADGDDVNSMNNYTPSEVYPSTGSGTEVRPTTGLETEVHPGNEGQDANYDFSDIITSSGVLEVMDGYGFLRSSDYNYLSSPDDIFVSPAQVKQYGLKTGDVVEGTIRPPKDNEKFFALVRVNKINGCEPSVVRDRVPFEYLTPLFPDEKFTLCSGKGDSYSSRIVDLFTPIGKGQRALIVAQPKTGKTLLMKDIANSIARNHPEAYLMMLLIDERPEEVTDMARTVNAEVIASTFDAPADNHVKIANLVLEKAKRMVECGHDVVIFLDSITRLARAYNTVSPASGKVLTGGVDANALQKPKRFFGAARNIEGGGSLTIIATALIDTGSKMDEVIFEEFKGTGNMELQLDRSLSNKRIFPSVNLVASSTRRDELLQDDITRRRMWILRKHISDMNVFESMDVVMGHIEKTQNNEEFLLSMNG